MGIKEIIAGFLLAGAIGTAGYVIHQKLEEDARKEQEARNSSTTKELLRNWQDVLEKHFNEKKDYPSDLTELRKYYLSGENKDQKYQEHDSFMSLQGAVDSWKNRFNYRRTTYSRLTINSSGKPAIIRNIPHYELSSSGEDKTPDTYDDIDAWFIPNHEWDSTKKLNAIFESDLKEAKKTPLEKTLEKGEGLLDRLNPYK